MEYIEKTSYINVDYKMAYESANHQRIILHKISRNQLCKDYKEKN